MRDEGQKSLGCGSMELVEEVKELLLQTAKALKGSEKRLFMARTVRALGKGGKTMAQRELGWNRRTIRKGEHELESGSCAWMPSRYGGESAVKSTCPTYSRISQPSWMDKVKPIHNASTNRLYTRLTATEVRRQLIA